VVIDRDQPYKATQEHEARVERRLRYLRLRRKYVESKTEDKIIPLPWRDLTSQYL